MTHNPHKTHYLILIIALALIPRLLLFFLNLPHPERWLTPDSLQYKTLADNLLQHHVFSLDNPGPSNPALQPDFLRTIGYPLFLAAIKAIASPDAAIIFIQILLSAISCGIIFHIAQSYIFFALPLPAGGVGGGYFANTPVSPKWPLIAGLAAALSLSSIVASQYLLSETLFTFLLTCQLALAFRYRARGDWASLIAATLLLGFMTHVRPIGLYWIWPQCLLLLIETRRPLTRRFLRISLSLLLFALILAPWYIRNYRLDGAAFFTTNTGTRMLDFNVAQLEALRQHIPLAQAREQLSAEVSREFQSHPDYYTTAHAQNIFRLALAKQKISQSPLLYARIHIISGIWLPNITSFFELIGQTQGRRGTLDILTRQGPIAAIRHYFGNRTWLIAFVLPWIILEGLIWIGVLLAVVGWMRGSCVSNLLFFLLFAGYYIALSAPAGEPRFREPAMPMLILAAAAGWQWLLSLKQKSDIEVIE